MSIEICAIEVNQPIGSFYIGKMKASTLAQIAKSKPRSSGSGVQRDIKASRTKAISLYCKDPDATFPTPIILAVKTDDLDGELTQMDVGDICHFGFKNNGVKFAEILDGQHRLEGIRLANSFDYDIPVVIMFDLTEEEKAYVFSTINSNQEKVDKSLIYQLFELSENRSPQKTCHEIARIMNSDPNSPFYGKLKMLGKATRKTEVLSQGTFVGYLCKLISKHPEKDMIKIKSGERLDGDDSCVLREYFIKDRDDVILKIINNYFGAVADVFSLEWNNPNEYVLCKTTGYGAMLKVFPTLMARGRAQGKLSREFFVEEFNAVKVALVAKGIDWTTNTVNLGEGGQSNLSKIILEIVS